MFIILTLKYKTSLESLFTLRLFLREGTRAGLAHLTVMALPPGTSLSPDKLQVMKTLMQHKDLLFDLQVSLLLRYLTVFSQLEQSLCWICF